MLVEAWVAGSLATGIMGYPRLISPVWDIMAAKSTKYTGGLAHFVYASILMVLISVLAPFFLRLVLDENEAGRFINGFKDGYTDEDED